MDNPSLRQLQAPLRARYKTEPESAMVTDHARTRSGDASDPFHAETIPMPGSGQTLPVGVHSALGGPHDAPTPGDILCAALAACQDSSFRMIANLFGIELEYLEVEVSGEVDMRGTMGVDPAVPTGFQSMNCSIRYRARPGTNPGLLDKLQAASEQSCVVLQTLRNSPVISTHFERPGAETKTSAVSNGD